MNCHDSNCIGRIVNFIAVIPSCGGFNMVSSSSCRIDKADQIDHLNRSCQHTFRNDPAPLKVRDFGEKCVRAKENCRQRATMLDVTGDFQLDVNSCDRPWAPKLSRP